VYDQKLRTKIAISGENRFNFHVSLVGVSSDGLDPVSDRLGNVLKSTSAPEPHSSHSYRYQHNNIIFNCEHSAEYSADESCRVVELEFPWNALMHLTLNATMSRRAHDSILIPGARPKMLAPHQLGNSKKPTLNQMELMRLEIFFFGRAELEATASLPRV
jgi:hypothetical protein